MTKSEIVGELRGLVGIFELGRMIFSATKLTRIASAVEALPDATPIDAPLHCKRCKEPIDGYCYDCGEKIWEQAMEESRRKEREADLQRSLELAAKIGQWKASHDRAAPPTDREREMWGLLDTLAETRSCGFKLPCLGGASTLCPVCDAKDFVNRHRPEFEAKQ